MLQIFDLGVGVENIQLELVERRHGGAGAQLADDGEGVDFPQGHIGPAALEGQHILAVDGLELIIRQAEGAQILDILRAENVSATVETVTCQPDQLVFTKPQGADVVELGAQHVFGNDCRRAEPPACG